MVWGKSAKYDSLRLLNAVFKMYMLMMCELFCLHT